MDKPFRTILFRITSSTPGEIFIFEFRLFDNLVGRAKPFPLAFDFLFGLAVAIPFQVLKPFQFDQRSLEQNLL